MEHPPAPQAGQSATQADNAGALLDDQLKRAQIRKVLAEATKTRAEAAASRRQLRATTWAEPLKVFGAVILGAGGVIAAFTQYEVAELKARNAQHELAVADRAKKEAEAQAAKARSDTESALQVRMKAEAATQAASAQLARAVQDRTEIESRIAGLKSELVQAESRLQASQVAREGLQKQVLLGLKDSAAKLAEKLLQRAKERGLDARLLSGYRSEADQERLYAQGRTQPGQIVTNARRSVHNTGLAFDVGIFQQGRLSGNSRDYETLGALGKELGLIWGGDWHPIVDTPHFETRDAQQALRSLTVP
ncbi:MAG: M15 family metallopeptidase [Pseudomonadota bacterium]